MWIDRFGTTDHLPFCFEQFEVDIEIHEDFTKGLTPRFTIVPCVVTPINYLTKSMTSEIFSDRQRQMTIHSFAVTFNLSLSKP